MLLYNTLAFGKRLLGMERNGKGKKLQVLGESFASRQCTWEDDDEEDDEAVVIIVIIMVRGFAFP